MKGIFVNEDGGIKYAAAIVDGYKPIETRAKNMLSALVGDRVAIVRTRRGKAPMVVGYVNVLSAEFHDGKWMDDHRHLTLIPAGSKHDNGGRGKWCYTLSDPTPCDPFPLPADAVRHGRSWCEFQAPSAEPRKALSADSRKSLSVMVASQLDRLAYLVDPYEYIGTVGTTEKAILRHVHTITADLVAGRTADYADWLRGLIDDDCTDRRDVERASAILERLKALSAA